LEAEDSGQFKCRAFEAGEEREGEKKKKRERIEGSEKQ
jgi:hypothetical protein